MMGVVVLVVALAVMVMVVAVAMHMPQKQLRWQWRHDDCHTQGYGGSVQAVTILTHLLHCKLFFSH